MIRALNLMALLVAFILAAALYVIKNDVTHAQSRLLSLQVQVQEAQTSVLLLEKEEAYLEAPERLAGLAKLHLGMVPMDETARRSSAVALKELQVGSANSLSQISLAALSSETE